jgi:hypothetical protein
MSEVDEAVRRFRDFHKRDPNGREIVRLESKPALALEVGHLVGIAYRPVSDLRGRPNYHDFQAPFARLFVSYNGRQIFVVGGGYTFTGRGFEK